MDMEYDLLVYKCVTREAFQFENYTGHDDILMLVESGEIVIDDGNEAQRIGPLEAVNFRKEIKYNRHITQPAKLHLFRYHAKNSVFGNSKVVFQDQARIRSTIALLRMSDRYLQLDDYSCKQVLFSDLVNQYRLENAELSTESSTTDALIEQALAYIDDNLHKKINFAMLAKEHYLSYVQFSRRFKNAVGTTPQNYIVAKRLKKAKAMLANTELSIKHIAESCGFASEYYFSNFFSKYCHTSPTKYRNMIKKMPD